MDRAAENLPIFAPLCIVVLLASFQLGFSAIEDGPLENGDFETIPAGAGTGEGAASIPGWEINGTVEVVRSGQRQGGMILIVPQGERAVRLGNEAGVSQRLELEKGSAYAVTFSAARTCAQLESLDLSAPGTSSTQAVDLQTLYSVQGWDTYSRAFRASSDVQPAKLEFTNPGMEEDPACGPIIDNIAIKKLFVPDRSQDNAVVNGDFEEGPWMFKSSTLGVLLPTNLDEETSSLPGWIVESNRAVRYIDSDHYTVPQGKRAVELLSGKEGIISQMVETRPETRYSLVFTMGSAGDSCQPPLAVMAFAGDQAENFHFALIGNATAMAANISFTARAERTRVAFYSVYYNTRSDDRSSLCGPLVDDVKVLELSAAARRHLSVAAILVILSAVSMALR